MIIPVPYNFNNVGDLSAASLVDPRTAAFAGESVDIDMRNCSFVWPAAALWCAIFPLLVKARDIPVRLLVPENEGTCIYLQSLGLFDLLKAAGVEVDDRGIAHRADSQVVLRLTQFNNETTVEDIVNDALDSLSNSGLGSSNLYPVVSEVFGELAMNAVQHSESSIGGLGFIQFYQFQQGRRFICAVADGGIGIRASLEKNPNVRSRVYYDWDAIELALAERVSGTGDSNRGIGLYGVSEEMRKPNRQLIINSGIGMLQIREDIQTQSRRTKRFPGTLTYASIPV